MQMIAAALKDCYKSSVAAKTPLKLRVFVGGRNRLENEGATALAECFKVIIFQFEFRNYSNIYLHLDGRNHGGGDNASKRYLPRWNHCLGGRVCSQSWNAGDQPQRQYFHGERCNSNRKRKFFSYFSIHFKVTFLHFAGAAHTEQLADYELRRLSSEISRRFNISGCVEKFMQEPSGLLIFIFCWFFQVFL